MWGITRFWEKVYIFEEGGSGYCSKKKDDICNEVIFCSLFSYKNLTHNWISYVSGYAFLWQERGKFSKFLVNFQKGEIFFH